MIKLCIDLEITNSYEISNHIKYLQAIYNMKKVEEQCELSTFTVPDLDDEFVEQKQDEKEPEILGEKEAEILPENPVKKKDDKIMCQCGVFFVKRNKSRHEKSVKHQEYMKIGN